MKSISVFCSINEVADEYVADARRLAELMVEHGYDLVWGGANRGLMKVVADGVQQAGGKITGITPDFLKHKRRMNADEMIIVDDISRTKALLIEKSDAIILLPGGTGSLDEITEVLELKKHGRYTKPVVVLNTAHFYEGFRMQLTRMEKDGFLQKNIGALIYFASHPKQAIDHINQYLHSS
jgi:hypothetical protein